MPLLNEAEALHFFSGAIGQAGPKSSFRDWSSNIRGPVFAEGAANFSLLRDHAHCEVERALVLAASNYRRAMDLLSPAATPWAFTTLYYAAFFSANALLGALGAWKLPKDKIIQADVTRPGNQKFVIRTVTSSYKGSHEKFWEFYFNNAISLIPNAFPAERFALSPISMDITWLISRRNGINYDTFKAVELASLHKNVFDPLNVAGSLPGELSTLFRFVDSIMAMSIRIARAIQINSDAVTALSAEVTLPLRLRQLVMDESPPNVALPPSYAVLNP
jgi:hypothetical protein